MNLRIQFNTSSTTPVEFFIEIYFNLRKDPGLETTIDYRDLFRSLFDSSMDAILVKTKEGRVVAANWAAQDLFGYTEEEFKNLTRFDLIDRSDSRYACFFERRKLTGHLNAELTFVRKNKSVFPGEVSSAMFQDTDGVQWISMFIRDITDRKRVEDAQHLLAEANKSLFTTLEFERMFESLAQLIVPHLADFCQIVICEEAGAIKPVASVHVNGEKSRLLKSSRLCYGNSNASPGVKRVLSTSKPELISVVTEACLREASESPEELEKAVLIDVRSLMILPLSANHRILGTILFGTSESNRVYSQQDLNFAQELVGRAALAADNARLFKESRIATRTRDEVMRIVAHDLRNPIAAISFGAELATKFLDTNLGGVRTQLERIQLSATKANHLIQDLLDVARMDSDQLSVKKQEESVLSLLREACELNQILADKNGLSLFIDADRQLPVIEADRDRVFQVFSNLIGNAVKFTPSGGQIRITAKLEPGRIRFGVTDSGPGIPTQQLSRIFDPFWQAERGSRNGVGLGLAIAKGIVHAHGGEIWVESHVGLGTTFYFTLPISNKIRAPRAQEHQPTNEPVEPKRRVLVVDDSAEMRTLISRLLEAHGLNVSEAQSARDGLRKAQTESPDLVITDIEMQNEDGYHFIEEFRRLYHDEDHPVPVVALTGHSSDEDRRKIADAGFDLHLTKPISGKKLFASIDRMLKKPTLH